MISATSVVFPGTGFSPIMAALTGVAGLALIVGHYRKSLAVFEYQRWLSGLLLGLRLAAVLVFALLLLNPILRLNVSPRDRQRVAVLVDCSKSMGLADSVGGEPRLKTAQRILDDQSVLSRLSDSALTDVFAFDSSARKLDVRALKADGDGSDLRDAISTIKNQKEKAPLTAIVMLSDGCETSAKSAADVAQGVPIYTVGLGSMLESVARNPDIDLSIIKSDHLAFIHSKTEIKVEISQNQLAGESAVVQIRLGPKVITEQTVTLTKEPQTVQMFFEPDEPGLFEYEAFVVPHKKETITENNSHFFSVKVTKEKIKVFYYEGTPRWTYKFLTRELKKDSQIALQAILRTDVGKAYQTSAGAGGDSALLPSTREGLKKFDCIVLGDVRAEDFSKTQATALREYVSDDGGGLIVLAGKDSYATGLAAMGLDAALPLSVDHAKEVAANFSVEATAQGASHPAFSGIPKLLPIESVYESTAVKPGAQVLAVAQSDKSSYPLFAAQRYGAGRVFMSLCDSDWKWSMKYTESGGSELYARLWGQVIRWAANKDADSSTQSTALVTTDKDIYKLGENVKFHAQGPGLENSKEALIAGESVPVQKNLNQYDGQYAPKKAGHFKITVGPATGEFLVERAANEFNRIAINEPLLRQIAATSGGQYFDAISARTIPDVLKSAGVIKVETRDYVLAETWWPFALIVLALAGEWSLRKRLQLN